MHRGCALFPRLCSSSLAGPVDIPRAPGHAFPLKTGCPMFMGCTRPEGANARGSSITSNAIMLKGRALIMSRLRSSLRPSNEYSHMPLKSRFIFSVLFRELLGSAAISLRFIAIFVDWQPRYLGLPELGPGLPNSMSKVAKMGRRVAKSAPFRVNLATWLATLGAAVKSSERVWWYLNNSLSLNCPESARRNAPPLAAATQLSDHGREAPFG
jgi:hypothetical protein